MHSPSASEAQSWLQLPYEFRGLFYKSEEQKCRGLLEIREVGFDGEPDLLVIMMNPGGSKPEDEHYVYPENKPDGFTATVPDATQWEVIKFMRDTKIEAKKRFKYARVINLSDLCKTSLEKADAKTFRKCSIFKDEAKGDTYFEESIEAILLAWGVDTHNIYKSLAKNAIEFVKGKNLKVYGYSKRGTPYFYHPLLRPGEWNQNKTWLEGVKPIEIKNI